MAVEGILIGVALGLSACAVIVAVFAMVAASEARSGLAGKVSRNEFVAGYSPDNHAAWESSATTTTTKTDSPNAELTPQAKKPKQVKRATTWQEVKRMAESSSGGPIVPEQIDV